MKRLRLAMLMALSVILVAVLVPAAGARPARGGVPVRAGFKLVIPSGMRLTGTTPRDRAMLRRSMVATSRPASARPGAQTEKAQAAAQADDTSDPACTLAPGTGGEWLETCVYGFTGFVPGTFNVQPLQWSVPAGLTSPTVTVQVAGASGGDSFGGVPGGNGEYISGEITVAPGDTLLLDPGQKGGDGASPDTHGNGTTEHGGVGGYPDGGFSATNRFLVTNSGGGGGESRIGIRRSGNGGPFTLFAAAAGGGGAGGEGASGATDEPVAAGAGGNAGAPGQPGMETGAGAGSDSDPFCTLSGGSPGGAGTGGSAGGGGAVGTDDCSGPEADVATAGQPGCNELIPDCCPQATACYGTSGRGGDTPAYVGYGGGGGGGFSGGGGGGGGADDNRTATGPLSAGGGGGGGGLGGWLPSVLSNVTDAVYGEHGDGTIALTFAVTPPDTTIQSSPTDPTDQTDATVSFTGTGLLGAAVDHFECQLDGGSWQTCTSPVTYPRLGTGQHSLAVRSVDVNGFTDPTPATASWTFVDTTPPETSIDSSSPPSPDYLPLASFTFSGTDNSGADGVDHFECQLDGAGFSPCTSPVSYTDIPFGDNSFQVRAVDWVGNVDPTPATFTWTVSSLDPSICTTTGASTTCTYTPAAMPAGLPYRPWLVPAGVTSVEVTADGGGGGANYETGETGGQGGRAVATIPVTPGEVLRIYPGGRGGDGTAQNGGGAGGANGGGAGAAHARSGAGGGGGGGASDIRQAPYGLGDRLVVAGGGGGAGPDFSDDDGLDGAGGVGGGTSGAAGDGQNPGGGGSQTAGGSAGASASGCSGFVGGLTATAGALGVGGRAATCNAALQGFFASGGGGGGYYGGGGGGDDDNLNAGGGGGGSSFAVPAATDVTLIAGGGQTGDGQVQITYRTTLAQTITFDPIAGRKITASPFAVAPTADSGLTVSVASDTTATCTVNGEEVTLVAPGTCSLTATQPGDDTHNPAAPVTRTFDVYTPNVAHDGGFEKPAEPSGGTIFDAGHRMGPWHVTSGSVGLTTNYWQNVAGAQSVDLAGNSPGAISQTFTLAWPGTYVVRFHYAGNPDGTPVRKHLTVSAGGVTVRKTFNTTGHSLASMGWKTATLRFTGTQGELVTLSFTDTDHGGTPYGMVLDHVTVIAR